MSVPGYRREKVRALVHAAYHAQRAQKAILTGVPSGRGERKANAEAACARVVDLLLEPDVLSVLAVVAGPFKGREGEVV